MMIVIEGPDNAGKSTLVAALAEATGLETQISGGPEKYKGEINDRVASFLAKWKNKDVIHDRHPIISHPIYSLFGAGGQTELDPRLVDMFLRTRPLFVYCRGRGTLEGHIAKDHDTPEHLEKITKNALAISHAYDRWADQYANLVYRIGDDIERTIHMIIGAIDNA